MYEFTMYSQGLGVDLTSSMRSRNLPENPLGRHQALSEVMEGICPMGPGYMILSRKGEGRHGDLLSLCFWR